MDIQYSVLLYSKFSVNCKKLFNIIDSSNINFTELIKLRTLCIDNSKIRERVMGDEKIQITIVPCILYIYPNGGIEKYDGEFAFELINGIIQQITAQQLEYEAKLKHNEQLFSEKVDKNIDHKNTEENNSENTHENEFDRNVINKIMNNDNKIENNSIDEKPKPQRKPISDKTSIGDLFENSDTDRHRNIPQKPRIKQSNLEYVDEPEAFADEPVDMRQPIGNTIKSSPQQSTDVHGTMSKMSAMLRERENIEQLVANQNNRPNDVRRP